MIATIAGFVLDAIKEKENKRLIYLNKKKLEQGKKLMREDK
jgi:hypothetical protein